MFPSGNLQGGTGISLNAKPPKNSTPSKRQVQGPSPMRLLEPTYNAPIAQPRSGANTQSLSVAAPEPPDPYAAWGGTDAYNRLVSGFDTQKSNIFGTSRDAASNYATGYKNNILDFLDSLRSGQRGVDERGVQNELAKKQGYNGIMSMIGRGLKSGGVMLAGKNATDSSATEQLGKAYGEIGRGEMGKVNNQYELENRGIGLAQEDLEVQEASGLRRINTGKEQAINSIVIEARDRLAALDAAMADANLPERIAIEQERNKIRNEVGDIIGKYDASLTSGVRDIDPTSTEDRRRTAFGLANEGVGAENPFDFNTDVSAQFQDTGPFASNLPLFLQPRRRET